MCRRTRSLTSVRQAPQQGTVSDSLPVTPVASLDDGGHVSPALAPALRPLRGRKRFTADLSELNAHPELIAHSGQWSVKSAKPGDEEASLEIVLANADERKTQTIILVVSDSSLYPDEHTYFGYSEDAGALESDVARVIDKLPAKTGCTLRAVVEFFVEAISRGDNYEGDDGNESGDDEIDFMFFDEDFWQSGYQGPSQTPQLSLGHLKKDFVEVKAAGYNPGILWTGSDRFILSVSLQVSDLFQHILPHALLAWDRHFLEPGLHLTLLISGFGDVYPVLRQDGTLAPDLLRAGSTLKFKVGFTQHYKPSKKNATAAFREFFFRHADNNGKEDTSDATTSGSDMMEFANDPDPGVFRRMSLSTSLESLLDQQLLRLLQLRQRFNLGWAGAEELLWQTETAQEDPVTVFQKKRKVFELAELDERKLSASNNLPSDPIGTSGSEMNILRISFVFLLRRLALSTRHCVVCHKKLRAQEALRPYVCASGLCVFQYYSLNLGPSIEQEIITNTGAVDLLVSLAYTSAAEGVLNEPLPYGMGLRVRRPASTSVQVDDDDNLCELDSLCLRDTRSAIVELLESLPPIQEMKEYLQRQFSTGNVKARLRDVDPDVLPAAWSILTWCVASCTAHIQELTKPEDRLRNLGERFPTGKYRQFRFLVGTPDKEKKFLNALPRGDYPTMFAFHGSPLKNWHSIIRHGLWLKNVLHGRSYGDGMSEEALSSPARSLTETFPGVYLSQDASVSLSHYAQTSSTMWKNSMTKPTACCTLAEIVNRREEFVSKCPYFVVDKTDWIMCRYLLVRTATKGNSDETNINVPPFGSYTDQQSPEEPKVGKYLVQERNFSTMLGATPIDVPQPSHQLDKLVRACVLEREEVILEAEDHAIFDGPEEPSGSGMHSSFPRDMNTNAETRQVPPRTDRVWKPDDKWIQRNAKELLPPPTESSLTATVALQREFRAMMREQNTALDRNDLATLGWYLPPQHNEDNLYQWLVELHSFDPELPIAKDMKSKGVPSVAMEIRFPPSFPHAPPFFRVIRPRFQPFMEGGGGHVTVGGSICMDLLTSDGWLPSYCVAAVLLQIKLAMSSTTPYPARLQSDWDRAYTPDEALRGYIRAASFHNWKIKNAGEIRKLVTAK